MIFFSRNVTKLILNIFFPVVNYILKHIQIFFPAFQEYGNKLDIHILWFNFLVIAFNPCKLENTQMTYNDTAFLWKMWEDSILTVLFSQSDATWVLLSLSHNMKIQK